MLSFVDRFKQLVIVVPGCNERWLTEQQRQDASLVAVQDVRTDNFTICKDQQAAPAYEEQIGQVAQRLAVNLQQYARTCQPEIRCRSNTPPGSWHKVTAALPEERRTVLAVYCDKAGVYTHHAFAFRAGGQWRALQQKPDTSVVGGDWCLDFTPSHWQFVDAPQVPEAS